jgi:hypothetical protein
VDPVQPSHYPANRKEIKNLKEDNTKEKKIKRRQFGRKNEKRTTQKKIKRGRFRI